MSVSGVRPRVALVTGAARGIGAATVMSLVGYGYQVVAVDRAAPDPALAYGLGTRADLEALAARAGAGRVVPVAADVRDVVALQSAVDLAEERFGRLDVAVAGARVVAGGVPFWEMPPEQERAVLDIDLGGVLNLARVAIPALLRAPGPRSGRFVAVSSAAAAAGVPMLAAFCAAEAGVTGLVRALGAELRGTDVTANAVSPAVADSMDRLPDPAEVAAVIAFLAGPDSSAVTGAVVPVDGGLAR